MTDRTAPADPREALAAALRKIDEDGVAYSPFLAPYGIRHNVPLILEALAEQGFVLAARQDEPSPALALVGLLNIRHSGQHQLDDGTWYDCVCVHHENARRALAANPPQTREAEGAALKLARCGTTTEVPHWHIFGPGDSVQSYDTEAEANAALAARTPEAQRDAEPPKLDDANTRQTASDTLR